jgi:predicted transcriptional regulator
MTKTLTEMAVEIATAQASHAAMSAEEAEQFLKKTFQALQEMKGLEEGEPGKEQPSEALSPLQEMALTNPKKSIQRYKVICLECGKESKVLTNRHLKEHAMDLKEYRKKYGFSARQALTAKTLSAKRRETAKNLGLGEKLQAGRKAKEEEKKAAPAPATKLRKSKAKAK